MDITLQAGQAQALLDARPPQGKGRAQKSEPGGGRSKQCLQNRETKQRQCHQHVSFVLLRNHQKSCRHFNFLPKKAGSFPWNLLCHTLRYLNLNDKKAVNKRLLQSPDMFQPDFMVFDRKLREGVSESLVPSHSVEHKPAIILCLGHWNSS